MLLKRNLREKTRRSIFATRRYLTFLKLTLEVTSKLFDSLFLPILLYGSEIWDVYDKNNLSTWEKDEIEKTRIYFCKQSLGVNKQCPNVAARNEIGRLPLKLNIDTSIIKFWVHLQNLSESDIAKQSLYLSEELAEKNLSSLSLRVNELLGKYNSTSTTLKENNINLLTSHLRLNMKKIFSDHQLMLINTNRKFLCLIQKRNQQIRNCIPNN